MKASKDCSALCLTPALVRPRVVPAWHTATGDNMGRTAASAEKKEFARQFASVVVVPTGWLNDMVARSGCAEYCQTQGTGRTSSARRARPSGASGPTAAHANLLSLAACVYRPWSLFACMSECFPNLVKGESMESRGGLQEAEFNKALQVGGMQRVRDRRVDAPAKLADPLGAGTYLFSNCCWRDPSDVKNRRALHQGFLSLVERYPAAARACSFERFVEVITKFHDGWKPYAGRARKKQKMWETRPPRQKEAGMEEEPGVAAPIARMSVDDCGPTGGAGGFGNEAGFGAFGRGVMGMAPGGLGRPGFENRTETKAGAMFGAGYTGANLPLEPTAPDLAQPYMAMYISR